MVAWMVGGGMNTQCHETYPHVIQIPWQQPRDVCQAGMTDNGEKGRPAP